MEIKKLSKDEIAEGLTLELVNSVDLTKYHPADFVQLQAGDEPVKLMKCQAGYWVVYGPGQYLKGADNKYMVFSERVCQIGRARYLFHNLKKEKNKKVKDLMKHWTDQVEVKIKQLRATTESKSNMGSGITDLLRNHVSAEKYTQIIAERQSEASRFKSGLDEVEKLWAEKKIVELLEVFNIHKFDTPMMQATFNNDREMQALINVFHKREIDKFDGDMLKLYAKIEVEKQYS